MTESDSSDDQMVELDECKESGDDGLKYRRLGKQGSTSVQHILIFGKIPLTIVLLALTVLLLVIIVLQVVTVGVFNQAVPCNGGDMEQTKGQDPTLQPLNNNSMLLNELFYVTQSSAQKLRNIVQTLSNLEDTSDSTRGAVDDILVVAEELLKLQNISLIFSSPHQHVSCQDVRDYDSDSPSGYYHINDQLMYCEMGELCGVEGPWTRIGYLDMADSAQNCPANFTLYEDFSVRGCGRQYPSTCASVKLPSNGISYSEVCGRVTGYQYGSPDADDTRFVSPSVHSDINQNYMDGVSITTGYPRQHIWSLMAGIYDSHYDDGNCPCNSPPGSTQRIQSFIGDNYFCESGNHYYDYTSQVYAGDPLWDGKGCGTQEQDCCTAPGLPWFYRSINATTDYIEVRECGDEPTWNEDVLVSFYEIYVK